MVPAHVWWFAASTLANVALLVVIVLLFAGVVYGYYTYSGSGISAHPSSGRGGSPGAAGPDAFSAFAARNPLPRYLERLADDVHLLGGIPPHAFNVYLIGDVLLDAGTRWAAARIKRQIRGVPLAAHALTHAHPDHQGSSSEICRLRGIPLWCGEGDADAMESGRLGALLAGKLRSRAAVAAWGGDAHKVERRLQEGDEVAGFTVLETPGDSPGHVSYWRASDRVLILGDVLLNVIPLTGVPGLYWPREWTPEQARLRLESARRLAALEPRLICFGHGAPLRDAGRFARFIDALEGAVA
jgi:glyoxylase-like metal-dependent hydrolase (beta-lactamase superfamily II)